MKVKPKLIFTPTIMFLLLSLYCFSQDTTKKETTSSFHQGITIGYSHQEVQFFSVGGKFLFDYDKENRERFGTGICMDIALNARILTFAPRIYAEYRERFMGVRLNVVNYIRQSDNEFRIIPEVFLCYKDYISLGIGYNFFKSGNDNFKDISLYRLSLTYAFLK